MIEVHLLVPTSVITALARFSPRHKDGHHGYFAAFTPKEFWDLVRSLSDSGHRIDVTPGMTYRLVARKEH